MIWWIALLLGIALMITGLFQRHNASAQNVGANQGIGVIIGGTSGGGGGGGGGSCLGAADFSDGCSVPVMVR